MDTMRDRFWIWGHEAGSHNTGWDLPGPSRMTPMEGAAYLDVPNLIMVRYRDLPEPPYAQYARALRPLQQVVWSIVGASGITTVEERDEVLAVAGDNPNITGVMMDDFFRRPSAEEDIAALSRQELVEVRKLLAAGERSLDLWVVLYEHQLDHPVAEHLELCDVVTYWTWEAPLLDQLEVNFARVEALTPGCRKVLGCYMWDYGLKQPMPLAAMEKQCSLARTWLQEGRIEGIIFLASCICDLELEAVEWTRQWIAEVGAEPV